MSTTSIFDSAMAGLQVAQAGMLATSQNVTGSSVDGYVRRSPNARVTGLAASSIDTGGTSFAVEGFSRNYSALLQKQLLTQMGRSAYTQELTRATAGIDAMLINPDTSIAAAVGKFFNAAGSLASDSTNIAYQQSLIGTAKQVVVRVRSLAEAISSVQDDAKQGLADVLNAANTAATQLADVNSRIQAGQVPGVSYPSPDLLDERDRLAAKLQELIGGASLLNEDGTASHQVGGLSLVDRSTANRFVNQGGGSPVRADKGLDGIRLQVRVGLGSTSPEGKEIKLTQPASFNANGQLVSPFRTVFSDGKAGAYAQLLTDFLPMMERGLNLFAATLVADVNAKMPGLGNRIFGFESSAGNVTDPDIIKKDWAGYSTMSVANLKATATATAFDAGSKTLTFSGLTGDAGNISGYRVFVAGVDTGRTVVSKTATTAVLSGEITWPAASSDVTFVPESQLLDEFSEVLDAADPGSSSLVYRSSVERGLLMDRLSAKSLMVVATNDSGQFTGVQNADAQAIEALRDSFISPLTMLTTRPATLISAWNQDNQMNETLQKSLQDQKNAISGVNLDEEAANLVKYQQLYNASSKLIQTGQQMFDMLLSMLAGR